MVFTTPTDTITRHKYSLSLFFFPMNCQKEGKKKKREGEEGSQLLHRVVSLSLNLHRFSKYSWSPTIFQQYLYISQGSFFSRAILDVYTSWPIEMKSCFLINFYFSTSSAILSLSIFPSYSPLKLFKLAINDFISVIFFNK